MKVLFYIGSLGRGGAERVIVNLAHSFSKVGYESVMVTSYCSEIEYPLSNDIRRIVLLEKNKKRGFIGRNIFLLRSIRSIVKQEKPDIIISFMPEMNFRIIIATRRLKVKKLISVRNDPDREYPNKILKFLAKTLYKKADAVVFQTEDAKKWFSKKIQSKSKVIANDVNPIFFETEYRGGKDIVTLGRLTEQKNHKLLIDAYKQICETHPDVNLRIYGSGKLETELKSHIASLNLENRVFLMGQTSNSHEVLANARCFALSSDFEGMPNALLEALVVGVPCISTDCPCGGPKCMIEDGVNGLLTPVCDVESMSNALDRILSDNEFATTLGKNARQSSVKYKSDTVFAEWKNYVDNICEH